MTFNAQLQARDISSSPPIHTQKERKKTTKKSTLLQMPDCFIIGKQWGMDGEADEDIFAIKLPSLPTAPVRIEYVSQSSFSCVITIIENETYFSIHDPTLWIQGRIPSTKDILFITLLR